MIFLLSKYDLGDKVKNIRLPRDVACKGEKCVQGRDGKPEGLEQFEDLEVDGNIV
jgi:hypothetical protein